MESRIRAPLPTTTWGPIETLGPSYSTRRGRGREGLDTFDPHGRVCHSLDIIKPRVPQMITYLGLGVNLSGRVNVNSTDNLRAIGGGVSQLFGVSLQKLLQVQSVHRDSGSKLGSVQKTVHGKHICPC